MNQLSMPHANFHHENHLALQFLPLQPIPLFIKVILALKRVCGMLSHIFRVSYQDNIPSYLRGLNGVVDEGVAVDAAEAGQGVVGVVADATELPIIVRIEIVQSSAAIVTSHTDNVS